MYNPFSLINKTILVTGSSSGIGRQIAIECSKMGASVIITGRNKERLQDTYDNLKGEGNCLVVCDLVDNSSFSKFCDGLPLIDGVVMCAAIFGSTPVKHNSEDYMMELFETNAFVNFRLSKYLVGKNKINKNGSIVYISSVASARPYKGNSLYSASKGAIDSFSKVLSIEVAAKKIRVNCIHPGIIWTKTDNDTAFSDEEWAKESSRIPLGFGRATDIANGCIYMLSDASRWMTGSDVIIDGGQSLI